MEHYTELLEKLMELEGLVMLSISRHNNDNDLNELVARRGLELADRLSGMFVNTEQPEEEDKTVEKEEPNLTESMGDEEAELKHDYVEPEVKPESEPSQESQQNDMLKEDDEEVYYSISDDDDEVVETASIKTEELKTEQEIKEIEKPEKKIKAGKSRRIIFSLNDKFLFLRELFDGDKKRFDEVVAFLEKMGNYDEATDYLVKKCGFDPENDLAEDFMERVRMAFQ